jgi:hypothetical protein
MKQDKDGVRGRAKALEQSDNTLCGVSASMSSVANSCCALAACGLCRLGTETHIEISWSTPPCVHRRQSACHTIDKSNVSSLITYGGLDRPPGACVALDKLQCTDVTACENTRWVVSMSHVDV